MLDITSKQNKKRFSKLSQALNIMAQIELSPPDKLIYSECLKGCSKGWVVASIAQSECSECGMIKEFNFSKKYRKE